MIKYLVVIILASIFLCTCKSEKDPTKSDNEILAETDTAAHDTVWVYDCSKCPRPCPEVSYFYSSTETGLPAGEVRAKAATTSNTGDNYISILTSSGKMEIVRDVDEDVYLNVKKGDIIR